MQGRSLDLRVFLEGIEVPVVSLRVEGGVSSPAAATLEIPAVPEAHDIKPRTLVHVFFAETSYVAGELTDKATSRTASLKDRNNYCLLFVGEAVAYKYVSVGSLRHIVLQCQDFTAYWTHAKLYWGTNKLSHQTYKRAITAGAVQVFDGKKRVDDSDVLLNLLMAKPVTIPKLTGILGGLVALMEAATGVYRPEAAKNFRGVNDFMGQAELRLQLTQTLGAAPDDTTSAKFIDARMFRQYIKRMAKSIGNQASFMDLLGLFLDRIYYTWTSVPMPPYLPRNENEKARTKRLEVARSKGKNSKTLKEVEKLITDLTKEVQGRFDVRQKRTEDSSVVEVGRWGNEYSTYTVDGQFQRDTAGHTTFDNSAGVQNFKRADFTTLSTRIRDEIGQRAFDARVGTALGSLTDAQDMLKVVTTKGEVQDTPNAKNKDGYPEHKEPNLQQIANDLRNAAKRVGVSDTITYKTVDEYRYALGDRLHCHMFMPDLYMAPPPTCNVLFPDQYTQIQFGRQWMSELTRLTMHTRTQSGQDAKDLYFAPNTSILKGPPAKDVEEAVTKGISFLMPHERFTGILHTIEAIEEASIFKKIHADVKKSQGEDKKYDPKSPPFAKVSGEALYSPMEHLRRAANFLFFQKRFASRTINVVARFSPQVVPGLPMLVLDGDPNVTTRFRTFDADGSQPNKARSSTGTHFLGLVAGVQHAIDATGQASTQITLVKCRTHKEGIDIFNPDAEGIATERKEVVTRKAQIRSKPLQKVTGLLPKTLANPEDELKDRQGNPVSISKTEAIRAAGFTPSKNKKYIVQDVVVLDDPTNLVKSKGQTGQSLISRLSERDNAPIATPQGAGRGLKTSTAVLDETLSGSLPVTFEVTVIEETRISQKSESRNISFAFEQTATPPWFAEIYLPHNIGKMFYQKMLGCGSILDESALVVSTQDTSTNVQITQDDRVVLSMKMPNGTTKEVEIPTNILDTPRTVQEAAERLAETWRGLTDAGANVALFVDAYTRRNCGSLPEIMGDKNQYLSFRAGTTLPEVADKDKQVGFHGNAYGQLTNLRDVDGKQMSPEGLLPRTQGDQKPVDKNAPQQAGPVNPSSDTRREKWNSIWEYQQRVMRFNGWKQEED